MTSKTPAKPDQSQIMYDKLGQEIKVGSIVVAPYSSTSIKICRTIKITPKNFRLSDVTTGTQLLKKHTEVICLDEMEALLMFLLSRNL